jgi:hypothetical protein
MHRNPLFYRDFSMTQAILGLRHSCVIEEQRASSNNLRVVRASLCEGFGLFLFVGLQRGRGTPSTHVLLVFLATRNSLAYRSPKSHPERSAIPASPCIP